MADDFGLWELKFPSSRAVNDDDDDEDEQISPEQEKELFPHVIYSPSFAKDHDISEKLECTLMVFGIGECSSTFLQAHYLCGKNSEVIAVITDKSIEKDFETLVNNPSELRNCALHRLEKNKNVVFCQIPKHVEMDKAFYWTTKIFDNIKPSKVIILTSSPACEYSSPEPWELKSDFVKMMKTKSWTQDCKASLDCGFIQTPNTVRGLPAAVLSHCEVVDIPAAMFACYTESAHVDVQAVETFKFLLSTGIFSKIEEAPAEETTKVLKTLGVGSRSDYNLYM